LKRRTIGVSGWAVAVALASIPAAAVEDAMAKTLNS